MDQPREWINLADQEARDIRQRFLRERIQVSPKDAEPSSRNLLQVSRTSKIDTEWFRSLGLKRQIIVRGTAAALETRKAVLIGIWSAAQWGMWFNSPEDHSVVFALPSGNQPSKSMLPVSTRFKTLKLQDEEIIELDGVRVTHPLRTYLDLCRMGDRTSARLAAGWLLNRGLDADEISSYVRHFQGPIHPNRKQTAAELPHSVAGLSSYPYLLAYSLLAEAGVNVRIHCELDEMGHAILLLGNDLVLAVDEDPLWHAVESEPHGRSLARRLRKRERWTAARGFRKLYFTTEEIEASPQEFVSEVRGATHLRRRDLFF